MLARCLSASLQGLEARPVVVEVDLAPGLPGVQLVGLPDKAIQESRERVRSALRNSGFRGPLVRVVINLAPADLRKKVLPLTSPSPWPCWWPAGNSPALSWRASGVRANWGSTAASGPVAG